MKQNTLIRTIPDSIPDIVSCMIGKQFDRWTVLSFDSYIKYPSGSSAYCINVKCECGTLRSLPAVAIRSGKSKSCGCYAVDCAKINSRKHGHSINYKGSKIYQAHRGMLNRCYRSKTKRFECYGGRGITVCDRWRFGVEDKSAFECFLEDMGDPPSTDHSIERKDVNGNYEPSNCLWITMAEQARNKTSNRWITAFGKTQIMQDWSKEYNVSPPLLYRRLQNGMAPEDALTYQHKVIVTPEMAKSIRADYATGEYTHKVLAAKHGISKSMTGYIVRGVYCDEVHP